MMTLQASGFCFCPNSPILTFQGRGTLDWSPSVPRSCGARGGGSTWGHWHHSSEAHSDGWKNSGSQLKGVGGRDRHAELRSWTVHNTTKLPSNCAWLMGHLNTLNTLFCFHMTKLERNTYLRKNTLNTNYANVNNPQYINCTIDSTLPV